MKHISNLLIFVAFIGLCWFVSPARAEQTAKSTASAIVRDFYAQLTNTFKQGDQLGFSGRYKKLEPILQTAFNFPLMTKIAVGSSWSNASPQEQSELVSAFSDFSIASYASQFVRDEGETFTVNAEKTTADGGVTVETTLQPKEGDAVTLNYMLRLDEKGVFRIVDVYLNGTISQLATRRAEFSSIARRDGIAALVYSLGAKSKEMGPS